jgi:hypothetical protein
MSNPEQWQSIYKEIADLRKRLDAIPPEDRGAEAAVEISCQLIELNQNVADLTEAVQAIADAP